MKNATVAGLIICTVLAVACTSSPIKVEEAREDVQRAGERLERANNAYLEEVAEYRYEMAEQIEVNKQNIAAFKVRLAKETLANEEAMYREVIELERKNQELEAKMDAYRANKKADWEYFQGAFDKDMNALENSVMELRVNSAKL